MNTLPLSLYVHLPWCVRKCPYCDFNSHTAGDAPPRKRYVDALLADLDREADRAGQRRIESIFLGGGTPSLFSPAEIGRLLDGVSSRFSVAADVEVTMEANPGTVEFGTPAAYREAGVNRLSIGAQSFDDEALGRLGRIHGSADIRRTVADVVAAGFDNFNIDLMHGLPGQTSASAAADIASAAALGPTHISWYQLTLEPNTVFYARPPAGLPGEEGAWEIQDAGAEKLRALGYQQYEVSAWALDEQRRCRHNVNYWQFGDYLAAGAGAHGKLSDGNGIQRYRKPANPLQYMLAIEKGGDVARSERLSDNDLVFEFMLNALRLRDGFKESLFTERTGLSIGTLSAAMRAPLEKGLVACDADQIWRPTDLGQRFLNDLQAEFLRDT
ncbi:MAG: radical SAM family heme chaperone HemW [Woeseiaceae bacterium]